MARRGVIDLRENNFQNLGFVNLSGEVEFYMHELLDPAAFSNSSDRPKDYITIPSLWNNLNESENPAFLVESHCRRRCVS